jgi:flagellar L-ring protein FlgH
LKIKILVLISFFCLPAVSHAVQFNEAKSRSLFSDIKAHNIGDLITVLIVEDAKASNAAKSTTKKDHKVEAGGGPGAGPFDFIPLWGMSGENKNDYDGEGQIQKSGSIRAKMTVKVIAVNDNGDLVIEGNRVIDVNADKETMFLTGIIRQRDISPTNSIYSFQIGDAQVSFKGKGQSHDASRPGILARFFNWIF